jgi:hypothetical protein
MTLCPHGRVTPRHCMWCLAAQLDTERDVHQRIRQAILAQRDACTTGEVFTDPQKETKRQILLPKGSSL